MSPLSEKPWTVMVYMAGDNNLDSAGLVDLKEMKKVGSTADLNVLAQFDRRGSGQQTNRYLLSKGSALERDVVVQLGETNTGDPRVLQSFIEWGAKNYPAKHYLVVIWNHGAGWDDANIYRAARSDLKLNITRRSAVADRPTGRVRGSVPLGRIRSVSRRGFRRALFRTSIEMALTTRAIAFDDNAQDFLDNVEMKKLLASLKQKLKRKIDVLGMDACLMNMVEVAYQMRGSVDYAVSSQETEPGDGWPYDAILSALAAKPSMSPRDLAGVVVKKYLSSYAPTEAVTQSALDLGQTEAIAASVDRLGKALAKSLGTESVKLALIQARAQVQSYEVADYIDLVDFCQLLQAQVGQAEIASACEDVVAAATSLGLIVASGYKGDRMAHSHGVSIYFPTRAVSRLYARLDFAKKTGWDEFLAAYLASTRRP